MRVVVLDQRRGVPGQPGGPLRRVVSGVPVRGDDFGGDTGQAPQVRLRPPGRLQSGQVAHVADVRAEPGLVALAETQGVLQIAPHGERGPHRDRQPQRAGQLLNHTHGIPAPDFPATTVEEAYADRFRVHDPRDMVRSATSKKPEFAPGERQHYLNIGYTITGLLIERVTGDTYERQVARRILRPLGLHDTYLPGKNPRIAGRHNHGYQTMRLDDGTTGLRDVSVWRATDGWAAGDIISTTADLERFTNALFQGRVVRGPLLEEMFTLPEVTDFRTGKPAAYSIGLSMKELGGREVWGKTGGRWGYNAAIASTRDGKRTLVYSVNSTDAKGQDMNKVAENIMVAVYGRP
ncbi:hypothetical protein SVIOM74S_05327 [Streptomyces violarus]